MYVSTKKISFLFFLFFFCLPFSYISNKEVLILNLFMHNEKRLQLFVLLLQLFLLLLLYDGRQRTTLFFFFFYYYSLLFHRSFAVLCVERKSTRDREQKRRVAHVLLDIAEVSALSRNRKRNAILAYMLVSSIIHA
jgi:hypothetical protein